MSDLKKTASALMSAAVIFFTSAALPADSLADTFAEGPAASVSEEYAVRDSDTTPRFTVGSVSGMQGDEVEVDIEISGNPGIIAYRLNLEFDPSVMTLTGVREYPMSDITDLNNDDIQFNMPYSGPLDKQPYVISWADAFSSHPLNKYNGKIVTLTFKLNLNANPGTYDLDLSFDPEDVFDKSFSNVKFTAVDGAITITEKCYHNSKVIHYAKAATCTADGNITYYYCSNCKKYFSDWFCTDEITEASTVIPATGHSAAFTAAKAATCTADGNKAYYYCSNCKKYFSDKACTKEITQASTVIPATGHTVTSTAAKAATCTADGNKTYYYCSNCKKYFSNKDCTAEITQASTVIPATGHSASATAAKAATCTSDGNKAYYYCSNCKKYFSDKDCTTEITKASTVIPATGHSVTSKAAKAATCTADGNKAYYYCSNCKKYFSDKDCTTEITKASTVIKSVGHIYNEEVIAPTETEKGYTLHTCSVCGDSYKDNYTDPTHIGVPKIIGTAKALGKDEGQPLTVTVTDSSGAACKVDLAEDGSFTVKDIPDGDYTVTVSKYGFAPKTVTAQVRSVPAQVEIKIYHYGDCDNNGAVNMKDYVLLQKYLNQWSVVIDELTANMNGDRAINMKDLTVLQRFLNGWPISFDF